MHLTEYSDYAAYYNSQKRTDAKKNSRPCLAQSEVAKIAEHLKRAEIPVNTIMCHGARYGQEVDWFAEQFPQAKTVGSDLFPKGHPAVVEWDFHKQLRRWKGYFSIVYSNALDHSYDPKKALRCWFDQLQPTGRLCVQWSQWHRLLESGTPGRC